MRWREAAGTIALALVALVFVVTSADRSPRPPAPRTTDKQPFRMRPVVVWSDPVLPAVVVEAVRPELVRVRAAVRRAGSELRYAWGHPPARIIERARHGHAIRVTLTQYCLQGTTRLDHWVREGIVAADPKLFPLTRYVELFLGEHYLGRFLVDDTGKNVHGATLDIWNPNCHEATRFGRQWGTAQLVVKPER